MPSATNSLHHERTEPKRTPNRLILCFDGTGNAFQGNTADTNIVKLYNKFDRSDPHQMHYYQPGIGTYPANGDSVNAGWVGRLQRSLSQTVDEGLATTFDSHVIAGYRFLMRYYGPGDYIYIFGFSRGAFTARFLARMVSQVGLLSMGNEEMVPFAYQTYQDYEMGKYNDGTEESTEGKKKGDKKKDLAYINNFKATFCRSDGEQGGIKVHFLGLFDTVSSVGTLDVPFSKNIIPPQVHGTAKHIRHAVAIDERRVKFKAALFAQEVSKKDMQKEDIKEVWFPGNHGDVGGGWQAVDPEKRTSQKTFGEKFESIVWSEPAQEASGEVKEDFYQLSDIPLKWMIDELEHLDNHGYEDSKIKWSAAKDGFLKHFGERRNDTLTSDSHDTMRLGGGSSLAKVVFWNFMEYLPFIKRWEYVKEKIGYTWNYVTFPLNKGGTRDIPEGAIFHHSVLERMECFEKYRPENTVGMTRDDSKPLKHIDMKYVQAHEEPDDQTKPLMETSFGVHETRKSRSYKHGHVETEPTYCVEVGPQSRLS